MNKNKNTYSFINIGAGRRLARRHGELNDRGRGKRRRRSALRWRVHILVAMPRGYNALCWRVHMLVTMPRSYHALRWRVHIVVTMPRSYHTLRWQTYLSYHAPWSPCRVLYVRPCTSAGASCIFPPHYPFIVLNYPCKSRIISAKR